ncbi:hypothetical protein NIES2119_15415 [[Phormidium ambiguum] IAM M-71]|uniref:Uncharacterized protein n=1 Tax=[Phormidium ambiguum] IAM M-71 TaxID=454136 RepID=A0A1U7II16_9CYAN|nr:hypothetical protein NIES2119_15415 [Phormidium ambiguum IAM M-71]
MQMATKKARAELWLANPDRDLFERGIISNLHIKQFSIPEVGIREIWRLVYIIYISPLYQQDQEIFC